MGIVPGRYFPELLDFDLDIFVFAAAGHTIVHFRVDIKFYLH